MTTEERPGREPILPRTIQELDEPEIRGDRALRVRGARVLYADYASLRADFPWLRTESLAERHQELAGVEGPARREEQARELIDRWLVRHAGLVSVTQAAQTIVNTPIQTEGEALPVHRPPRSGRAFVVDLAELGAAPDSQAGLLDLKGVGLAPEMRPARGVRADGLMPADEGLRELFHRQVLDVVLEHAGAPYRCLPHYALLDLGFDLLLADDSALPAGALVRRGHRRPPGGLDAPRYGTPEHSLHLELELLLRRYGVTAATHRYTLSRPSEGKLSLVYGGRDVTGGRQGATRRLWELFEEHRSAATSEEVYLDGINTQTTRAMDGGRIELVDFGHYRIRPRFTEILLSQVCDREAYWGGVIRPGSAHYVQPDPDLALPARFWQEREVARDVLIGLGCSPGDDPLGGREREEPLLPLVEQLCLHLTRDFRGGRLTSAAVETSISRLARRVTAHLSQPGDAAHGSPS